ncbi:MAG: hypothetical protein RRY36_06510 [Bacteroidaceae bacterium]
MSVAEIRKRIKVILKYNLPNFKINRAMDKLGYVSTRNTFFRGFIVILLSSSESTDNKNDKFIKEEQKQSELPF